MSLKKNVVANILGQGWTALMGLAFIPVYIGYMGIEAWGLVGFMSMLQAWLTLLDMGLTPTLSREITRFQAGAGSTQAMRDLLRSLEVIYGCIAVTVMGLIWLASPWIAANWLSASQLSGQSMAQAIAIMGLVLAARMVEQIYRGAIHGLQQQVWLNGAQSILATLRWAGVICVLAWVSPSVEAFFLWQGFVSMLSVFVLSHKTYRSLPPAARGARFDIDAVMGIRSFAGGIAATTFLALLLTQVDKLLLSKLVTLEEFGYYTLAGTVASVLYFFTSPMVTAVAPRLTELVTKSEQAALVDTYQRSSQVLAAGLIPAALVIAAYAEPLLYAWSGNPALSRQVAPLLALLSLGTLCNCFMHIPYMLQLAHGWTGFALRMNIVAVAFIVPAVWLVVPRFGAIGAAWVWLVLNVGYVLIGIHFMHRRLLQGEKWRWYLESIFKPLSVAAVIVLVLRQLIELPQDRMWMAVVLAMILTIVTLTVLWSVPASRKFMQHQLNSLRGKVNNV